MGTLSNITEDHLSIVSDTLDNRPVIYCISNNINDSCYIGSAQNFRRRIRQHLAKLVTNKHRNKYLQRSWNKYGYQNFDISVLSNSTKETLIQDEQWSLDINKPEYNICKVAGNTAGLKWDETRRRKQCLYLSNKPKSHIDKLSQSLRQNKQAIIEYTKRCKIMCETNKRPILITDLLDNPLYEFSSIKEAGLFENIGRQMILTRLRGVVKSPYQNKYKFRYKYPK